MIEPEQQSDYEVKWIFDPSEEIDFLKDQQVDFDQNTDKNTELPEEFKKIFDQQENTNEDDYKDDYKIDTYIIDKQAENNNNYETQEKPVVKHVSAKDLRPKKGFVERIKSFFLRKK